MLCPHHEHYQVHLLARVGDRPVRPQPVRAPAGAGISRRAWNSAEEDGLEAASLAHASLFAALATFVRMHGDEATADLVEQLPERIRNGEYNLERILQ